MKFELEEILTVIDRVADAGLTFFAYEDAETMLKIKGAKKETKKKTKKAKTSEAEEKRSRFDACPRREALKAEKEDVEKTEPQSPAPSGETLAETFAKEGAGDHVIVSPMVGTFYAAPQEGAEPFVRVGDVIRSGQVVGIVEAMKLMNEIESDCDGIVEEILVENNKLVEYEQPLIRVRSAQK